MLGQEELQRYGRQMAILGHEGQMKIKKSRVLIAGAGGLGTVIATYLAAAGVGTIRVVDHDRVELSNLNRQILHWTNDEGRAKTASVEEKLLALNPHVQVETDSLTIGEETADDAIGDALMIVDAMDNFPTRYTLNRAAQRHGIPLFHGAVRGFYGQVTTIIPGSSACLRCAFPQGPPVETFPIVGVTCGVIGSIQATEVIKYITGVGELLTGRLLFWDGLRGQVDWIAIEKNPTCRDCG
jgi:molybdopterin/thiamine biosynthesis adenylyltransferase